MTTYVIQCTWCPWRMITEHKTKAVAEIADSHITFHGRQLTADVESYLEGYIDQKEETGESD